MQKENGWKFVHRLCIESLISNLNISLGNAGDLLLTSGDLEDRIFRPLVGGHIFGMANPISKLTI